MSKPLDPGTFGGTPACHILVIKLNNAGDANLANSLIRRIQKHSYYLGEAMKLDNPLRDSFMKMFHEQVLNEARKTLTPRFEENGIEFSYFENVLTWHFRHAKESGALLEDVLTELKRMNDE